MTQRIDQPVELSPETRSERRDTSLLKQGILGGGIRQRIDFMASHMFYQLKEFDAAEKRTGEMFEKMLCQLNEAVVSFQQAFIRRNIPVHNVSLAIDADRSVAIVQLMWHRISFTTRGNIKPMAIKCAGQEPYFAGRIIAILGDYSDVYNGMYSSEFPEMLEDELASLYVPGSPAQPAMMRFRNPDQEDCFFHQSDATQQFLLKVFETICGGGYFHEIAAC